MAKRSSRVRFAYDFEQPVEELDGQIEDLKRRTSGTGDEGGPADEELAGRIRELEERRDELLRELVANLTPYQRVKLARHPLRPQSRDYIGLIFKDFMELHGDRRFGDDKAVIAGLARLPLDPQNASDGEGHRLMLIAQQKGRDSKDKVAHNFGMPNPEGYRKALAKMELAEKFHLPVVCMIDTPGAAPAMEAEERGQAMAIAQNIFEMSGLSTPIVVLITGEGCSGGMLGMGVGDRFAMLENAYFSVISPEGCAAILWRSADVADKAAEAMKVTAQDMLELGVIDTIIEEPPGGAHRDAALTASNIAAYLARTLAELSAVPIDRLREERYEKYRSLGSFTSV